MASETIDNTDWRDRPIKCVGAGARLLVVSLRSNCGDIRNGIAFRFEDEKGAWVVDLNDLKKVIEDAEKLNLRGWPF